MEHAARPRRERDAQRAPRRVERELQRLAARRSILEATAVVAPPVRGQPVRRGELARARREAGHRGRGAGADGPERVAGDREERKVQRDGRRLGRRARDPGARGGRQGPPRLCPRGRRRRGRGRVAAGRRERAPRRGDLVRDGFEVPGQAPFHEAVREAVRVHAQRREVALGRGYVCVCAEAHSLDLATGVGPVWGRGELAVGFLTGL